MAYKRAMTTTAAPTDASADLVEAACRLIDATDDRVPPVAELADALAVSPDVLRRAFSRVLGVTPRQYADARRRDRLRGGLQSEVRGLHRVRPGQGR